MTANYPTIDLVHINDYIKFGQILSICSQNIEQKHLFSRYREETEFWRKSRAITLVQIC